MEIGKTNGYLDTLSKEMIENLFLATNNKLIKDIYVHKYKYCYEGSSSFSLDWKYKEHWYKDLEYFNSLQVGSVGYVLRNRGFQDLLIYSCVIVLKDLVNRIIIFEVSEMWHCRSSVNEQLVELGII
jgi:hypothetical protein